MKKTALLAGLLIATLNGLLFVPGLEAQGPYFVAGSLTLALWLALKALMAKDAAGAVEAAPVMGAPVAPAPEEGVSQPRNAEAEVVAVVGALQAKGRFVDFLMDDISKYSDAQVGAAARVVHGGCKEAFAAVFAVEPVASESEGATVSVPKDAAALYRLSGSISGEGPYSGKLVHKGWRASRVTLPRIVGEVGEAQSVIAPAQVEVK